MSNVLFMQYELINVQSAIISAFPVVTPETRLIDTLIVMNQTNKNECSLGELKHPDDNNYSSHTAATGCVLVIQDEKLIGILTERDTVRLAVKGNSLEMTRVEEVMTQPVISLPYKEFTDLFAAYNIMRRYQIRHLPLLDDDEKVLGLVTLTSLRQVLNGSHFLRFRQVSEVMTHQVLTVSPLSNLMEIAHILTDYRISCVVVVEERQGMRFPVGIVTERDLLQMQTLQVNLQELKAHAVMSQPLFCIQATESLSQAQTAMQKRNIRRLVVVGEQGELQGILTETNLAQVLDPFELYGILEILERKVIQLEEDRLTLLQKPNLALAQALQNNEFYLHYQPQFSLKTGEIVGMEALIRWNSPEKGFIPPSEFIPIAENTGLIVPIGQWVLRTACTHAMSLQNRGYPPLYLSVNISAQQLGQETFVQDTLAILRETGFDPRWLELELTESVLVKNVNVTLEQFKHLQGSGIKIAIDDFGTGYASLSYLQNFSFDILKIDRCFISNVTENNRNIAIVSAIIRMANQLNFKVIAEGVETEKERDFLAEQGCDIIQGYLISRPLPAEDFYDLLMSFRLSHLNRSFTPLS
jgi:EAL domain-containing protein (putative c-di-GMP-specific phosphodiesterase class I)